MSRDVERSAFGEICESIISSLSVGIVAFDPDLEVIDANAQACDYIDVRRTIGESLNVGIAAAVTLFEINRSRRYTRNDSSSR